MENGSPTRATQEGEGKSSKGAAAAIENDVTPGEVVNTLATPPDASSSERIDKSPPAKRRREDRERTRVSRACDRCKK
jgi:hypothetical protein